MTTRFSHDALPLDENGEIVLATDSLPTSETVEESLDLGFGSETVSSPSAMFVPEYYEPNYAYPLLVWLHDEGGSERDMLRMMPQISERNYFGLSIRGPLQTNGGRYGYRWSQHFDDVVSVEEELFAHVRRMRQTYHIHTERVFIGGSGAGGTLALQLGLRRPEWFAGVVSVDGQMPSMEKPLANYRRLQGKRTMLAARTMTGQAEREQTSQLGRLLHAAGITVSSRCYDCEDRLHGDVLRDIDRWMMQECYRAVAVDY